MGPNGPAVLCAVGDRFTLKYSLVDELAAAARHFARADEKFFVMTMEVVEDRLLETQEGGWPRGHFFH